MNDRTDLQSRMWSLLMVLALMLGAALVAACGGSISLAPTPTLTSTVTFASTVTPTPTEVPPTATPMPPTATPKPTDTPHPTATLASA